MGWCKIRIALYIYLLCRFLFLLRFTRQLLVSLYNLLCSLVVFLAFLVLTSMCCGIVRHVTDVSCFFLSVCLCMILLCFSEADANLRYSRRSLAGSNFIEHTGKPCTPTIRFPNHKIICL